uniref:RNA-dependent RNA polymerase n=1 Tax=String-of-pearls partitivirus TaxID=2933099 RepID=A0A9C7GX68_9VIRU|nr:RNA-dependent RNA polymerase [String-of-pearls partitivirus]CAI5383989.1 RNA-dependent RNA polymerase [String-of-pearls partitivirus]
MQNTVVIGYKPKLAKALHGNPDPGSNPAYRDTVDHALRRFLTAEEFDIVTKGYRRSPWNDEALKEDIAKLDSIEHPVIKDKHYYRALSHAYRLFSPKNKMKPVHFADLRHYPWQLSSNIGAPFATSKEWQKYVNEKFDLGGQSPKVRDLFKEAHHQALYPSMIDRRMTKRNLYNEMFLINRKNIHLIKDGRKTTDSGHDLRYWNTAFARQHLVEEDDPDKVRLVFGAPSTLLMAELMFIWPLQVSLLARGPESPMLWGYETLTGGWSRLYTWANKVQPRYGSVVTLDWSRFDKDARHTVIRDIHRMVMRPMFDFNNGYHPTIYYPETPDTNPHRLENLWNWMTDAVLTTPLMLPDGTILQFTHSGIYSGFFQTQILDSIYNCVMIFTILSRMGFDIEKISIKVQGDDSIFLMPYSYITIKDTFLNFFSQYANVYFGSTVNIKKSEVRETLEGAEVLRYRNHGTMPERDELQLLAMLRHPERTASLESLMARTIGVAYANCGNYTRVYNICEDIYNFLAKGGFKPDPFGLPGGLRYKQNYIPSYVEIDLTRFPTYFDTVRSLQDPQREILTQHHWPELHFIGIPGKS